MSFSTATNAINEDDLRMEETDVSCRFEYFEMVPLTRDTDGSSCTTECVNGDWSAGVKHGNSAVVKQEPHRVCCVICIVFNLSQQ